MDTMMIERDYYDILKEQAVLTPNKPALVQKNRTITYAGLTDRIDHIAAFLISKGLNRQDKVALFSVASPLWLCAYYGIIRAGGIAVVLNANYTLTDCAPLISHSDSSFVIFGKTHDTYDCEASGIALSDAFNMPVDRVFNLSMFDNDTKMEKSVDKSVSIPPVNIHDPAYIIYTSGTTAFPKAVVTSQYGIINVTHSLAEGLGKSRGMSACMAVPLFHAYGIMVSFIYLQNGGTVYMPDKIKPDSVTRLIKDNKISDLWSVAAIYQEIADDTALSGLVAPYVRMCTIAGAYTSPAQFKCFESAFCNSVFINMYGMTETCAAYCLTRPDDSAFVRHHTVGRPISGVELAIWNKERGILPPGEIGEIVTRGYHLKNEYYKLPSKDQGIDEDGWLHSGDLGSLDEEGNLKITGRIKDIIIKGGENIAPAEIESKVMEMPGIKECRIFGYQDKKYGENLGACITLDKKDDFNEGRVKGLLKKLIGSYKTPSFFIIYDKFPLNANGKVDQLKLHFDMRLKIGRLQRRRWHSLSN